MIKSISNFSSSLDICMALPPQAQSRRELHSLLSIEFLKSPFMAQESILSITRIGSDFLIETTSYFIPITLSYLPPLILGFAGPARFEFHVDEHRITVKEMSIDSSLEETSVRGIEQSMIQIQELLAKLKRDQYDFGKNWKIEYREDDCGYTIQLT